MMNTQNVESKTYISAVKILVRESCDTGVSNSSLDVVNTTETELENCNDTILSGQPSSTSQTCSSNQWSKNDIQIQPIISHPNINLCSNTLLEDKNYNQWNVSTNQQQPIRHEIPDCHCTPSDAISISQSKTSQDSLTSAKFYLTEDIQVEITSAQPMNCSLQKLSTDLKNEEDNETVSYRSAASFPSVQDLDTHYFSDTGTSFKSELSPECVSVQVSHQKSIADFANKTTKILQQEEKNQKKISIYGNGDKVRQIKSANGMKPTSQSSFEKCMYWLQRNNFSLQMQTGESTIYSQNISSKDRKYKSYFQHVASPDPFKTPHSNFLVSYSYSHPVIFTDPVTTMSSRINHNTEQKIAVHDKTSCPAPTPLQGITDDTMKCTDSCKKSSESYLPMKSPAADIDPIHTSMVLPRKDFNSLASIQSVHAKNEESNTNCLQPKCNSAQDPQNSFHPKFSSIPFSSEGIPTQSTKHSPNSVANLSQDQHDRPNASTAADDEAQLPFSADNVNVKADTEPQNFLKTSSLLSPNQNDHQEPPNHFICEVHDILDFFNGHASCYFTSKEINDILSQYTDPAIGLDLPSQDPIQVFMFQNPEVKGMYKKLQGRHWQHGLLVAALKKRFEEMKNNRDTENVAPPSESTVSTLDNESKNHEMTANTNDDVTVLFYRNIPQSSTSSVMLKETTARPDHFVTTDNLSHEAQQNAATECTQRSVTLQEPVTHAGMLNTGSALQVQNAITNEVTPAQDGTNAGYTIHQPKSYIPPTKENFNKAKEVLTEALAVKAFQTARNIKSVQKEAKTKQKMEYAGAEDKTETQVLEIPKTLAQQNVKRNYSRDTAFPGTDVTVKCVQTGIKSKDKLENGNSDAHQKDRNTDIQEISQSIYHKMFLRTKVLGATAFQEKQGHVTSSAKEIISQQEEKQLPRRKASIEETNTHAILPRDIPEDCTSIYNKHYLREKAFALTAFNKAQNTHNELEQATDQETKHSMNEEELEKEEYQQEMKQNGTKQKNPEKCDRSKEILEESVNQLLQQTNQNQNIPEEDKEVLQAANYQKNFLRAKALAVAAFERKNCSDTKSVPQTTEKAPDGQQISESCSVSEGNLEQMDWNTHQQDRENERPMTEQPNLPADIQEISRSLNYHQNFLKIKALALSAFQDTKCTEATVQNVASKEELEDDEKQKVEHSDVDKRNLKQACDRQSETLQASFRQEAIEQTAAQQTPTNIQDYKKSNYNKILLKKKAVAVSAIQRGRNTEIKLGQESESHNCDLSISSYHTPKQTTRQQNITTDFKEIQETFEATKKDTDMKLSTQLQTSENNSSKKNENRLMKSKQPLTLSEKPQTETSARGPRSVSSMIRRWDKRLCHPSKSTINFFASIQNLHQTESITKVQSYTENEFTTQNSKTMNASVDENSKLRLSVHDFNSSRMSLHTKTPNKSGHVYSQNMSASAKLESVLASVGSDPSINFKTVTRPTVPDIMPSNSTSHHKAPSYVGKTYANHNILKHAASANAQCTVEQQSHKNTSSADIPATMTPRD